MTVITNFLERKQEKQLNFERKALRELTLPDISKDVRKMFFPFFNDSVLFHKELEETSIDMAIEAYLIGANYSKFSFYGETEKEIRWRSRKEVKHYTDTLFDYWLFWCNSERVNESLYRACEAFIERWWGEGFQKGEKRHRLRLH